MSNKEINQRADIQKEFEGIARQKKAIKEQKKAQVELVPGKGNRMKKVQKGLTPSQKGQITKKKNLQKKKMKKALAIATIFILGLAVYAGYDFKKFMDDQPNMIETQTFIVEEKEDKKEVTIETPKDDKDVVAEYTAAVTAYTDVDSCHYPDGKGGCLNAANKVAREGTIACPKWIKMHSIVEIDGTRYVCEDRTAEWVQKRNGMTFDVFFGYGQEAHEEAKKFGKKTKIVKLLKR